MAHAGSHDDTVDFASLTSRAQVLRLRRVAFDALAHYPIRAVRMRVVFHGHNTTFRVDTDDGSIYALRVNVGSESGIEHLDAETAWLAALARDTDVAVPVPLPARDGRLHVAVDSPVFGRRFLVAVMSWLPGRNLAGRASEALEAVGRLTATLHDHAAHWSPPPGSRLDSHRDVLIGQDVAVADGHPLVTDGMRELLDATLADTQAQLDGLWAGQTARPIHGDLHAGNMKWRHGRLAVFDFDDALMGVPAQDLGITAYYLLAGEQGIDMERVFAGYEQVRPLPAFTDRQFAAIQAGRNLLLVYEMLRAVNADLRGALGPYLDNARLKLGAYLETGVYRHDVPGVVPIPW